MDRHPISFSPLSLPFSQTPLLLQKILQVELSTLINIFKGHPGLKELIEWLKEPKESIYLKGLSGSSFALAGALLERQFNHLSVFYYKEAAAYFYHHLVQ